MNKTVNTDIKLNTHAHTHKELLNISLPPILKKKELQNNFVFLHQTERNMLLL